MSPVPDDLLVATAAGQPVAVDDLTGPGLDVNAVGAGVPRTPLMAAAFAGRADLIRALVERGAGLNVTNPHGLTALHEAAAEDHADAVRTLLDLGADIEAASTHGHTPLMVAAAWGCGDVVRLLLARGADVHHRDQAGCSALAIAEEKDQEEATILRAAGATDCSNR